MSSYLYPDEGCESTEMRPDGLSVYRYWLERRWSEEPGYILWVMFNPSTAAIGSDNGDRAVPLCLKRSQRIVTQTGLMVGAMRIVNLFARRSTDVDADSWPGGNTLRSSAWIGPSNDDHISEQAGGAALTVAAWGPSLITKKKAVWRSRRVEALLKDPWCLEVNPSGHPYYAGPRGAPTLADIVPLSVARATSR
jgi:hypothetical protein